MQDTSWELSWCISVSPGPFWVSSKRMDTAVHVVDGGEDELRQKVCDLIAARAGEASASRGQFTVGFSGGSAAKIVCSGLRGRSDIDWAKWRVFTCDERHVQLSDPDSNIAYVQRELLDHVSVPADQVYPIDPSLDVGAAAEDYVAKIRKVFPDEAKTPSFDLLILGMGPDGHTCSLFPGHPGLDEMAKLVIPITDSPKPPPNRITLTFPVLNSARCVVVIGTGSSKADVIKQSLEPDLDLEQPALPIARVTPHSGDLIWFLDTASAIKLNKKTF